MEWTAVKKELLGDPAMKKAYDDLALEHEFARAIIKQPPRSAPTARRA